jgi:hypothetical protein
MPSYSKEPGEILAELLLEREELVALCIRAADALERCNSVLLWGGYPDLVQELRKAAK